MIFVNSRELILFLYDKDEYNIFNLKMKAKLILFLQHPIQSQNETKFFLNYIKYFEDSYFYLKNVMKTLKDLVLLGQQRTLENLPGKQDPL
jgi:hypothetical protein